MVHVLGLTLKPQSGAGEKWLLFRWLTREEKVVARRRLEPRQVRKLFFRDGRQLHKAAPAVAEPAQLALRADVVGDGNGFEDKLEEEHRKAEEYEEEEEACHHSV